MTIDQYFQALTGFPPRQFQRQAIAHLLNRQDVLLRAPTGSGKTETAIAPFLFAKTLQRDFPNKLIYVVPLRTLANSLRQRAETLARTWETFIEERRGFDDEEEEQDAEKGRRGDAERVIEKFPASPCHRVPVSSSFPASPCHRVPVSSSFPVSPCPRVFFFPRVPVSPCPRVFFLPRVPVSPCPRVSSTTLSPSGGDAANWREPRRPQI
jgi:hypothetical protein